MRRIATATTTRTGARARAVPRRPRSRAARPRRAAPRSPRRSPRRARARGVRSGPSRSSSSASVRSTIAMSFMRPSADCTRATRRRKRLAPRPAVEIAEELARVAQLLELDPHARGAPRRMRRAGRRAAPPCGSAARTARRRTRARARAAQRRLLVERLVAPRARGDPAAQREHEPRIARRADARAHRLVALVAQHDPPPCAAARTRGRRRAARSPRAGSRA